MKTPSGLELVPILSVNIKREFDLVTARQRARQLAFLLGFQSQDQTKIATAVSEIARNAYQYAGGGRLDFAMDLRSTPQMLWMQISDGGKGIPDLNSVLSGSYESRTGLGIGLSGSSRLMDEFDIRSSTGSGTVVSFGKFIPGGSKYISMADIGELCAALARQQTSGAIDELERQNKDLLETLNTLRVRETELQRRQEELARLNLELEETNRGVVALYAELDDKALALRRADEMKSRFLSHVSHEFRTPVNSVLALTRLLLQRTDGELSSEQEKQILYIRDAARQLAEIVNDLLDLAKVEAGKTDVRKTHIDVGQFLGAIRALMRPLATNEAVALVFEEPDANLTIESDESKLGQILRNLISNALKFTQQGEVRVRVSLNSAQDSIVFAVTDTGIGIAPDDQDRIFNEFTQIENPVQKHVKGTGLGLPLSRKLAALLGGAIQVESSLGAGSTFTLVLPCHGAAIRAAVPPEESQDGLPTKTILIVDDETSSHYLVQRLLAGTSYRTVGTNGAEAAERARFELPALILLDLGMPDRSGFEVLAELKSYPATRDIPVIIHTAKLLTESECARLENKVAGVLPKATTGRLPALMTIRNILGEPHLFSSEPEFN